MKRIIALALAAGFFLLGDDCSGVPDSEQIQNQAQERTNLQAVRAVGMPAISNFFEKRQLKSIYELRDRAVSTYTYIADLQGHLHKVCDSIGFGIPYATEYTNPQQVTDSGSSYNEYGKVIPQADPNGLYSPASAAGTWVLCLNPKTKQTQPTYVEPDVLVSQFPLQTQ
jgi:hypothetical protein